MYDRPEQLIDLIINRDYWEIIDVQTIIMMSISYILSKEIPSVTRLCKSIWCLIQRLDCHKPEYRCMICQRMSKMYSKLVSLLWYAYNRI